MKRYFIYHLRWQISALVMMPIMLLLEAQGWPLWLNLMAGQLVGAFIFWEVDKRIFGTHKEDSTEEFLDNELLDETVQENFKYKKFYKEGEPLTNNKHPNAEVVEYNYSI